MKKTSFLTANRRESITGYVFILPYLIGCVIVNFLPMIMVVLISFTNMKYVTLRISNIKFVGFRNYDRVFHDHQFWMSMLRTLYYSAVYIPLILVVGLALALLINSKIYCRNGIRTLIFIPYVSNIVAVAIVWNIMYSYNNGIINMTLKNFGVKNPPMWLVGNTGIVIPSIVIVHVWVSVALFFMTYLAALQDIPEQLYEAARIDGASKTQSFFRITIPMLSTTNFLLLITAIITSMQNFSIVTNLTKGGPGDASTTQSIYTYNEAITYKHMNTGSSQIVIMMIILLAITLIQKRGQKKWEE
ncbi:MAG TPA: sugar ABC transporter permease [Ruminiclostridium sp.]|nr:sugar ABC transporter permease [Ruminiclostridium sp.]